MFNLLISYGPESWTSSPFELDRNRVAIEYTADEISERYKFLDDKAIEELKGFPSLFVVEDEEVESRVGYITNVRLRQATVVFDFELDTILPSLPIGAVEALRIEFDLGRWELTRTHWAIKDEPLLDILVRKGYFTSQQVEASQALKNRAASQPPMIPSAPGEFNASQVFIVHGHDEITKLEMKDFVAELGLEPIILHMQASSSRTIIEKIEYYSNVGFGIILYTPCDIGVKAGQLNSRYRARQNVVFEHGFLIGKLGRPRIAAFVKGDVETPNDISGMVYISMDEQGAWKQELIKDLRAAGYQV